MLYLRLFLIFPDVGGDLSVQVLSEYEEFKRHWDDLQSREQRSALVHIGFSRPDNEEIIQIFYRNPDKILFTSAAVNVLSKLLDIKTSFLESLFNEYYYMLGENTNFVASLEASAQPKSDGVDLSLIHI